MYVSQSLCKTHTHIHTDSMYVCVHALLLLQTTKLNIADMESLMPKGDSDGAATLLPKLMELHSKVEYIEGQVWCSVCTVS